MLKSRIRSEKLLSDGLFKIMAVTLMVTAPCIESFVHCNLFYISLHNLFFKQSLVLASLTRIRLLSGHTRTKYNQHLQVASS